MDIEERIEIRADLIYTGILDAVERLKNQSVDVFMEKVRLDGTSPASRPLFGDARNSLAVFSFL